jgi:hypothetical protein
MPGLLTHEAEALGSCVQGQPELHRELQDSLGYIVKPSPKTNKQSQRSKCGWASFIAFITHTFTSPVTYKDLS